MGTFREVSGYQSPAVRDLGSLAELTQSLLPSVQGAATPMAALSAPLAPAGGAASGGETVELQSVGGSGDSSSGVEGGGDGGGGENGGGGGGAAGGGESAPTVLGPGTEGALPFTGAAAGAVGAVGAALTGAGLAIRRALRRR
jgi:hypothetical protein